MKEKDIVPVIKNNIIEISISKRERNIFEWLSKACKSVGREETDNLFFVKDESIAATNGYCIHVWNMSPYKIENGTYEIIAKSKKKIFFEKRENSFVFTSVFELLKKDPEPIENIDEKTVFLNRSFQAQFLIDALWINNFIGRQYTELNFFKNVVKISGQKYDRELNEVEEFESMVMRCENFTDPILKFCNAIV